MGYRGENLSPPALFFFFPLRAPRKTPDEKNDERFYPPRYLALEQGLAQANNRFKRYADSNLLCGKDGLPHLIADGNPEYFAQFVFPGLGFLYTAGYIGTTGRKYIKTVAKTKNPAEKEIIIDVPLALTISLSNYLWPLDAWKEFLAGDLVANKDEITVSPR